MSCLSKVSIRSRGARHRRDDAPNGAAAHKKGGHSQDVNGDGWTDLVSQYRTQETGITPGDETACVGGDLFDRTPFKGCDDVRTVPQCGLGLELVIAVPLLAWARRRRAS